MNVVQREFEKYSPVLSNRIFVTLQTVMVEVMKIGGGNNYKTPHINKASLEREGKLPMCNEHGTIYAISSDFCDRMTTQSMGLMVLLSEHF